MCVSKRAIEPGPASLRRHDPSLSAMLFQCGEGTFWRLVAGLWEAWLKARIGFGSLCVSKRAHAPRPAALRRHDLYLSLTAMLFQCGGTWILEVFSGVHGSYRVWFWFYSSICVSKRANEPRRDGSYIGFGSMRFRAMPCRCWLGVLGPLFLVTFPYKTHVVKFLEHHSPHHTASSMLHVFIHTGGRQGGPINTGNGVGFLNTRYGM